MTRLTVAALVLIAGAAQAQSQDSLLRVVQQDMRPPILFEHRKVAEKATLALDSLPSASAASRIQAHAALLRSYRADDIDLDIAYHAKAIIHLANEVDEHDRKRLASDLIDAYRDFAEVYGDYGNSNGALALLRTAPNEMLGDLGDDIARFEMIGHPAPSITGRYWINPVNGQTTMNLSSGGPITILQMTAWWCHACSQGLSDLKWLQKKYGADKIRIVVATTLNGSFRKVPHLEPQFEAHLLEGYFVDEHQVTGPVAIGDYWDLDPNLKAYHVSAIPQTFVIDQQGRISRILDGWDMDNSNRIRKAISLLAPTP